MTCEPVVTLVPTPAPPIRALVRHFNGQSRRASLVVDLALEPARFRLMTRETFALLVLLVVAGPLWCRVAMLARDLGSSSSVRTFGRKLNDAILITLAALGVIAAAWLGGDLRHSPTVEQPSSE
jgi:hypothetical protein